MSPAKSGMAATQKGCDVGDSSHSFAFPDLFLALALAFSGFSLAFLWLLVGCCADDLLLFRWIDFGEGDGHICLWRSTGLDSVCGDGKVALMSGAEDVSGAEQQGSGDDVVLLPSPQQLLDWMHKMLRGGFHWIGAVLGEVS
ncbi:hypothetical protein Dimus_030000 [Dionaea muscipula]